MVNESAGRSTRASATSTWPSESIQGPPQSDRARFPDHVDGSHSNPCPPRGLPVGAEAALQKRKPEPVPALTSHSASVRVRVAVLALV